MDAPKEKSSLSRKEKFKQLPFYVKLGGILAGAGGAGTVLYPIVLSFILQHAMVLEEGSIVTQLWERVPFPIPMRAYIFNIENPREFAKGQKPLLRQMGPYYYHYWRWREVISWDKETVKYYDYWAFMYDQEKSNGRLTDKVTLINLPVYITYSVMKTVIEKLPFSFAIKPIAFSATNVFFTTYGEGLFKHLTIDELLNSYRFPIMDLLDLVIKPLQWLGIKLPPERLPQNRLGLFHVRNFTNRVGPFEAYTGKGGTKFLHYLTYRGDRMLTKYDDPRCNMINGTEGAYFGTFIKEKTIYFFFSDFCRSFRLDNTGMAFVAGIATQRYSFEKSFSGPNKVPENMCFCRTRKNYEKCDGIFHLGTCYLDIPVSISLPHFLHASEHIQSGVDGLDPDPDLHEAYLDMETTLGAPLAGAFRMQVNIMLEPIAYAAGMSNFKEVVLPYIWLEAAMGLQDAPILGFFAAIGIYIMRLADYGSPIAAVVGSGVLGYYGFKQRGMKGKTANDVESQNNNTEYKTPNVDNDLNEVRDELPNVSHNVQINNDNGLGLNIQSNSTVLKENLYPELLEVFEDREFNQMNPNSLKKYLNTIPEQNTERKQIESNVKSINKNHQRFNETPDENETFDEKSIKSEINYVNDNENLDKKSYENEKFEEIIDAKFDEIISPISTPSEEEINAKKAIAPIDAN